MKFFNFHPNGTERMHEERGFHIWLGLARVIRRIWALQFSASLVPSSSTPTSLEETWKADGFAIEWNGIYCRNAQVREEQRLHMINDSVERRNEKLKIY